MRSPTRLNAHRLVKKCDRPSSSGEHQCYERATNKRTYEKCLARLIALRHHTAYECLRVSHSRDTDSCVNGGHDVRVVYFVCHVVVHYACDTPGTYPPTDSRGNPALMRRCLLALVLMRRCLLSVSATIGFTTRNGMAYDVSMYMVECCSAPVAMLEVGRERRVGI